MTLASALHAASASGAPCGRQAQCCAALGPAGIQASQLLWRLHNGGMPQRQPPVQLLHVGAADLDAAYSARGSAGAVAAASGIVSRYDTAA